MKYVHFLALSHPYSAKDVAELFVKEVVRLHGFPKIIVSDKDRLFMCNFRTEMFKLANTKLRYSMTYHLQLDGQLEVVNCCLGTYLRCFASMKPKSWPQWLSWAEYWYNTNNHALTKMTPFKALYGKDPLTLVRGDTAPFHVEDDNQLIQDSNLMLDELKE